MTRLSKGMYGSEFRNAETMFGIRCGQMRGRDMVHNGGWYNSAGEKLGWGDLAPEDFLRISAELEDGELFIILGEHDSFWNFVTSNPGPIGSCAKTEPTADAPGVDFVSDKCRYIIAKGQYYYVDQFGHFEGKTVNHSGLNFTVLNRGEAKAIIERANPSNS